MVETYADIGKVSESIREGEVSPLEIVNECLERTCGFDANRLPIGLQIVAGPWDEVSTLDLASRYQRATSWNEQRPDS